MKKLGVVFTVLGAVLTITGAAGLWFTHFDSNYLQISFSMFWFYNLFSLVFELGAALLIPGILLLVTNKWAGSGYNIKTCITAGAISAFVSAIVWLMILSFTSKIYIIAFLLMILLIFLIVLYVYLRKQLKLKRGMLVDLTVFLFWLFPFSNIVIRIIRFLAIYFWNF